MSNTREGKVSALAIKGLVNGVNVVQMPPGCCRLARNVVFREQGVVGSDEVFFAGTTIASNNSTITGVVQDLRVPGESPLSLGKGTGAFVDTTTTLNSRTRKVWRQTLADDVERTGSYLTRTFSVNPTISQLPTNITKTAFRNIGAFPGTVRALFSDGRQFLTEKWTTITDFARSAGAPRPKFGAFQSISAAGEGGFLPYEYCCKYKVTYAVVYRQGPDSPVSYDVEGAPTGAFFYRNLDVVGGTNVSIDIRLAREVEGFVTGRTGEQILLRVYRSVMGDSTDTAENLGSEYRMVGEVTVNTAADEWLLGGSVVFVDKVTEPEREARPLLYTEEEGATKENLLPPAATDIAWFRDCVLYANYAYWPTKTVGFDGPFGYTDATTPDRKHAVGKHTFFSDGATYGISTTGGSSTVTIVTDSTVNDQPIYAGQRISVNGVSFPTPIVQSVTYTAPGTWTLVIASNASSSATRVGGFVSDRMRVTAVYVDGTTQANTFEVFSLAGFIEESNNFIPGLRVVPSVLAQTEATTSASAVITITGTWAKRIQYFTVEANGGDRYWPDLPEIGSNPLQPITSIQENRRNRVFVSKPQLPESVAPDAYINIGHGSIIRLVSTDLCVYAFCTDGLYRVDGVYDQWTVSRIDPTLILSGSECVAAVGAVVYAWTTKGLFAVYGDATTRLDENAYRTSTDYNRNLAYSFNANPYHSAARLFYDTLRDEVLFDWRYRLDASYGYAELLRYNVKTKIFSTFTLRADATNIRSITGVAIDSDFVSGGFVSGLGGELYAITRDDAASSSVVWNGYAPNTTPVGTPQSAKVAVIRFWPQYADDTSDLNMFQDFLLHWKVLGNTAKLETVFLGDAYVTGVSVVSTVSSSNDIKLSRAFTPSGRQSVYAGGVVLIISKDDTNDLYFGFELCGFEWYFRASNSVPVR